MYSLWLENSLRTLSLIADVLTYHELIYSSSACQPSWSPRGHGWAERAWPSGRRRLFWEASERAHGGFDAVKWPVRITHGECHAVQALCWELHMGQPVCPAQRRVEATVMFQFGGWENWGPERKPECLVLYSVREPRFETPSRGRPLNGILLNWPVWVWLRSRGPG